MVNDLHFLACRDRGQTFQSGNKAGPFLFRQPRREAVTETQCGVAFAVNATRALGDDGDACAEGLEQIEVRLKRGLFAPKLARGEEGAVPATDESEVMTAERLGERRCSSRIRVTEL